MRKILFATGNKNKLREAREILGIQVESISLDVDEVQTLDPIECIEKKAEAAFKQAEEPVLVEDTSLSLNAWQGLPGVFIDYFMKTMGNAGLLRLMAGEKNRAAKAQTSLCLFDGKQKIVATGIIEGHITDSEKGENGFGWDTIFVPKGKDKTFAQMSSEEKNKISMRKLALEELKRKIV